MNTTTRPMFTILSHMNEDIILDYIMLSLRMEIIQICVKILIIVQILRLTTLLNIQSGLMV